MPIGFVDEDSEIPWRELVDDYDARLARAREIHDRVAVVLLEDQRAHFEELVGRVEVCPSLSPPPFEKGAWMRR